MLDLTMTAALTDDQVAAVLRHAETLMLAPDDAKKAAVTAVIHHFAESKMFDVFDPINSPLETEAMLGVPDKDVVASLLMQHLPNLGMLPGDVANLVAYSGDNVDVPQTLRAVIAAALTKKGPMPMHRGKWLSKLGITQPMLDTLKPAAVVYEAPPEETLAQPAGPQEAFDLEAMLGGEPVPEPVAETISSAPPVASASVKEAFQQYSAAMDTKDDDVAKRLGISRSTLSNFYNGKTQKVRITLEQARVMLSEIDTRIGMLNAAAEAFRTVR
jgi:hypothetical protein